MIELIMIKIRKDRHMLSTIDASYVGRYAEALRIHLSEDETAAVLRYIKSLIMIP